MNRFIYTGLEPGVVRAWGVSRAANTNYTGLEPDGNESADTEFVASTLVEGFALDSQRPAQLDH